MANRYLCEVHETVDEVVPLQEPGRVLLLRDLLPGQLDGAGLTVVLLLGSIRGYGLWVMGYGLWVMGYGLWVRG